MHRTVRTNLKCFKDRTRVGALPRIGVTGVVVFQTITVWLIIKFFQNKLG
jgi:hypothetical protein